MEAELADIFRNTSPAIPKKPATLNVVTHGLTGQNLILTAEELPRYAKMGLDYMLECRPVGARETANVQLMFEGRWRMHRVLANAFQDTARTRDLIGRYETRSVRNGSRLNAELKELQKDRARQRPDLLFEETASDAVDWYRRLLARSEVLAKAKQTYEDYEAAESVRSEEKSVGAEDEQAQSARVGCGRIRMFAKPCTTR